MDNRSQPSATAALVHCVVAFLFFGGLAPTRAQLVGYWGPPNLVVSPDGQRLYVTGLDCRSIDIIDTATHQFLATLSFPVEVYGCVHQPAVSPDGNRLYVPIHREPPNRSTLEIVDLSTGKVVSSVPTGQDPINALVSPDGGRVYVVNRRGENVSVIDTASSRVIATIPLGFMPLSAALTPDGKKLYVTSASPSASSGDLRGGVTVIDTTANGIKTTVLVHRGPSAVAASPDGRWIYVTHWAYDSGMIDVIATASDELANKNPGPIPGGTSHDLAVSPDGRRLYVLPSPWNFVAEIDSTNQEVLGVADVGPWPHYLALSPDGRRLYVSHMLFADSPTRETITVLDAPNLRVVATIILPKPIRSRN
jgi:YVTN family beta-propeller protein